MSAVTSFSAAARRVCTQALWQLFERKHYGNCLRHKGAEKRGRTFALGDVTSVNSSSGTDDSDCMVTKLAEMNPSQQKFATLQDTCCLKLLRSFGGRRAWWEGSMHVWTMMRAGAACGGGRFIYRTSVTLQVAALTPSDMLTQTDSACKRTQELTRQDFLLLL